MSGPLLTLFGVVILALSTLAGTVSASWISKRASVRASDQADAVAQRVVDRDDFDSVMTRMDKDLDRSDRRMSELESRLELEVAARVKAEERALQAEDRALQAEARAQRLERRVTQLEAILRESGMQIPPAESANPHT